MNSENNKMLEKIWNLRDYVQNLEEIKEDIINNLKFLKDLDDLTRNIWVSYVQEYFYSTISAQEVLTVTEEKLEYHFFKISYKSPS